LFAVLLLLSLFDSLDLRAGAAGFGLTAVTGASGGAGWAGAAAVSLFVSVVAALAAGSAGFEFEQANKNELKAAKARNFGIRLYMFPPFRNTMTLSQTDTPPQRLKKKYNSRPWFF